MATKTTGRIEFEAATSHLATLSVRWFRPVLMPFLVSRIPILSASMCLEWLLATGRAVQFGYIGHAPLSPLSATFDGNWYMDIAANGYSTSPNVDIQQNYQFRPLFPLLTRVLGSLFGLQNVSGGFGLAGVLISHICFLLALGFLFQLTVKLFDPKMATYTAWVAALLPWSIVFSMAYTEALFLLLSLAVANLLISGPTESDGWKVAGIGLLIALASLTRAQGIILTVPAFLILVIGSNTLSWRPRIRNLLLIMVPPLIAVIGLMAYIGLTTGNFSASLQVSQTWGKGWLEEQMHIFTLPPQNPAWYVDLYTTIGLITWVILTSILVLNFVRKSSEAKLATSGNRAMLRVMSIYAIAYLVFTLATIPANTGLGRYMIVVFPCIWAAAMLAKKARRLLSARMLVAFAICLQILVLTATILLQFTL